MNNIYVQVQHIKSINKATLDLCDLTFRAPTPSLRLRLSPSNYTCTVLCYTTIR